MPYKFNISKTLKQNLPSSVTASTDTIELHVTEDGEIYINNIIGELIKCGVTFSNEDVLKRFSVDNTGELLFDGLPIKSTCDNVDGGNGTSEFKSFEQFIANKYYSYGQVIMYNNILYSAKKSFTTSETFNNEDWNIIAGDMTRSVYDTDNDGIVDRAERADVADFALETNLLQSWKPNKQYQIGQQLIYLNKIYAVSNNHVFDSNNLELIATGIHSDLINLDGGGNNEYYHLTKTSHDVLSNVKDVNGTLMYKTKTIGDMTKDIYDTNKNGYVDYAENIVGVTVSINEINQLAGVKSNIQSQINLLSHGMVFKGTVPTFANLATSYPDPQQGYAVVVEMDENMENSRTFYIYSENKWVCLGLFQIEIRDFSINPINLSDEVIGILPESMIDPILLGKIVDSHQHTNIGLLDTYNQPNENIADAVNKRHIHNNKNILDTYNQTNENIADAVAKKHAHINKHVIDYLTESSDGNLLFKGNLIQGGGIGGGIKDLSMFTTNDLVDFPNKRYTTDAEKSNLAVLPSIISEQNSIKTNITKIQTIIPETANVNNKLLDKLSLDAAINNINVLDMAGIDKNIQPSHVLITNSTSNGIEFRNTNLFKIISMIKDSNDQTFSNVSDIVFKELEGKINLEGYLELSLKELSTTNLLDMPKVYEDGKVLVCNKNTMSYELVNVSELTNSHENYSVRIDISDWILNDGKYQKVITHNLNSTNLIVAMYDLNNNFKSLQYKILNINEILITSDTNEVFNIVINCSQGVVNGSGNGSTNSSISASDFIDDTRVRLDKTYSSSKIANLLQSYVLKNNVYSKIESDAKYSLKDNEHVHGNYNTLSGFSEDIYGNVYFKSKKLLNDFNPYTIKKNWTEQSFDILSTLVNIRDIYNENNIKIIMSSEIIIRNTAPVLSDGTKEMTRIVIVEDGIVTLDVNIEPSTTQKYILGINPDTTILLEGSFIANLCINAY